MPEELPVDVAPCSNEEYFPFPPTREQLGIMRLANEETERYRRKFNMSRAEFVRTASAMAIGFWAIDTVRKGVYGSYGWAHNTATTNACDLEWDGKRGAETLNNLAKSRRSVMHAFVMPNRGSAGRNSPPGSPKPAYFDEEMQLMEERAAKYRDRLRGWKTYCAWGDIPYASGWWLDSDIGMAFLQQVKKVSDMFPEIPPVVATHKGFALPGFDQAAATPRDVGVAAKANPGVHFLIYHSGYDLGDKQAPYAGDDKATSDAHKVDALIKSLRENHWDATKFVEP